MISTIFWIGLITICSVSFEKTIKAVARMQHVKRVVQNWKMAFILVPYWILMRM